MDNNRELGIITENAEALARLRATLAADWERATSLKPPPTGVLSWQEAGQYVGQEVTVEGDIVRTYDSGKVTFLNFAEEYSGKLSVVIFASDYGLFPDPPADYFLDKRIRVQGLVKEYRGAPEIVVESPGQIEVVGEVAGEVVASSTSAPQETPLPTEPIPWQDASGYLGQTITVEGDVVRTYNSGKVAFLNFAEEYRGTLSIVIFADDFDKFPSSPEVLFKGQRIRVSGRVKEYQGAPEIVVDEPDQIEILHTDGDSETPSPLAAPTATSSAPPASVVSWEDAANYLGQTITVRGRIVRAHDTGNITFLNFSSERDQFVAVVFADDYAKFPQLPVDLYDGKELWITGEIASYKGAPQIVIRSPEQVEVFP